MSEHPLDRLDVASDGDGEAASGGYAYGAPPFGYRAEGGELVPEPVEQETVRRIGQLRDKGASYREIADEFSGEGIAAKRTDRWHPMAVKRIADRSATDATAR